MMTLKVIIIREHEAFILNINFMENKDSLFKQLLRLRNISQAQLAKSIGLTPQRIANRINSLNFSTDEFPSMARLLKIKEQDLFAIIKGDKEAFNKEIQK